jgi:predicted permease
MDAFWADLRYAIRTFLRTPTVTVVILITMACGIGVTTAIFSLVNAVLVEPLPYPDPDRLILLVNTRRGQVGSSPFVSAPRMNAWREHSPGIREVTAYLVGPPLNLTGVTQPQQVVGGRVSAGLFRLFGARFAHGRPFTVAEDQPNGPQVAVLSYGLWQRQWGGDRRIVGQQISINEDPVIVVGVLDARFDARSLSPLVVAPPDIWLPLRLNPYTRDDANILLAAARLAPGVSIDIARQQAERAASVFRDAFPGELPPDASFGVAPLEAIVVGDVRSSLWLLFGTVGLVTLIVCANTANLLLGRAAARERELAIRTAVGASRRRLVRQLVTESVVLCGIGGAVGCALGGLGLSVLLHLQVLVIPRIGQLGSSAMEMLDARVLWFALATSVTSGVACGVVPAMKVCRDQTTVEATLTGRMHPGAGRHSSRARTVLVVAEMSIACVLVIASVLLIRSFANLQSVDLGFDRRNILTMRTTFADRRFATTSGTLRVVRAGLQRMADLPGVESAAISLAGVPLEQGGALSVTVVGRPLDRPFVPYWSAISPQYFDVFKIRLIRGRLFTDRDAQDSLPIAIITEALARQLWPNGDPFRDRILIGQGAGPAFEEDVARHIVGIVTDVRQVGLYRPARPGVYVPIAQLPDRQTAFFHRVGFSPTWTIRTRTDPHVPADSAQRELLHATGLPSANIRTMDDVFEAAAAPMALNTWLMTGFGSLALLLAVIGMYAIAGYSVQQRTHEIGVRRALGAESWQVWNMVVWQTMRVTLAGVVIGMAAAAGLARVLATFLFGITALDGVTFTVVPLILVAAGLAGVCVPARRAARVDPMAALRGE